MAIDLIARGMAMDIASTTFSPVSEAEFNTGVLLKSYKTTPVQYDWRLVENTTNHKLDYEIYDMAATDQPLTWNFVSQIGSLTTDDFIINKSSGGLFFQSPYDNKRYDLTRITSDLKGLILGNMDGNIALAGNKSARLVTPFSNTAVTYIPPNDNNTFREYDEMHYDRRTTINFVNETFSFELEEEPPTNTICRVAIELLLEDGSSYMLVENVSLSGYIGALNNPSANTSLLCHSGLNTVTFTSPRPILSNVSTKVQFNFSNPVKLKGHIGGTNVFIPYIELGGKIFNYETLATQEWSTKEIFNDQLAILRKKDDDGKYFAALRWSGDDDLLVGDNNSNNKRIWLQTTSDGVGVSYDGDDYFDTAGNSTSNISGESFAISGYRPSKNIRLDNIKVENVTSVAGTQVKLRIINETTGVRHWENGEDSDAFKFSIDKNCWSLATTAGEQTFNLRETVGSVYMSKDYTYRFELSFSKSATLVGVLGTKIPKIILLAKEDIWEKVATNEQLNSVFITNIEKVNTDDALNIIWNDSTENKVVKSLSTDATSLKVTITWRANTVYQGRPNCCDVDITTYDSKVGNEYINTVTVDISSLDSLTCNLGNFEHITPIIKLNKPVISSVTLSNIYPFLTWTGATTIHQTALKKDDIAFLGVVADIDFDRVETDDFEAGTKNIHNIWDVSNNPGMVVPYMVADTNSTSGDTQQHVRVRVRSVNGSWSNWYVSDNTVTCNDVLPTCTVGTIKYNGESEQGAIKLLEQAEIPLNITYCQDYVRDITIESILSEINSTITSVDSSYSAPTYSGTKTITVAKNMSQGIHYSNLTTPNVKYTIRNAHNGAIITNNIVVKIVDMGALYTQESLDFKFRIRGGETGRFNAKLTQPNMIQTLWNLYDIGTITIDPPIPQNEFTDSVVIDISATLDEINTDANNAYGFLLNSTTLSDKTVSISKDYYVNGFVPQTYTLTYPENTVTIPKITNINNVKISAQINSTSPYTLCRNNVTTPTNAGDYNITGTTLTLPPVNILANYYYNNENNITIIIEET